MPKADKQNRKYAYHPRAAYPVTPPGIATVLTIQSAL